jgi:hypothetical protein
MWRFISLSAIVVLLHFTPARSQPLDIDKIKEVAKTIRNMCLSGSQYDLRVNADGSLSILKLAPGGKGQIRITQSTGTGGALNYKDEGIRLKADQQILGCIKDNLPILLDSAGAHIAPVNAAVVEHSHDVRIIQGNHNQ